jgi:hypothetical protein
MEYFEKREIAGLKMPKKKKANTEKEKSSTTAGKKQTTIKSSDVDISDVWLEGQDKDEVAIYMTCDDVRNAIEAHLRTTDATQASFLRSITSMFTNPPQKGCSAGGLKTFLSSDGSMMGASSPIFYGSYVFLEKMRIAQGKPKSEKRLKMEKMWAPKGVDVRKDLKTRMWMHVDNRLFTDKYGSVEIHKKDWAVPEGWIVWG